MFERSAMDWCRSSRFRLVAAWLAVTVAACSHDGAPTAAGTSQLSTIGTLGTDPAAVELSVSDITNFWAAYDAFAASKNVSTFQSQYLDRASAGLVDFMRIRSVTAQSLAQTVTAYPQYFAAIRPNMMSLAAGTLNAQIRAGFAKMKLVYAATVFPTVTFLVGRFSTAGTISNNRILIGTEFYSAGPGVPTGELGAFQQTNVKPQSWLPVVVAHEHVHILQSRSGGIFGRSSLLEQALAEGSADFVGELASGGNINAWIRDYALPREHELWVEFQAAMSGTDVSQWLYNQTGVASSRPGDLGYFMGYRIAEAYYLRAADKTQAVKDIIEMANARTFLTASGYNP